MISLQSQFSLKINEESERFASFYLSICIYFARKITSFYFNTAASFLIASLTFFWTILP